MIRNHVGAKLQFIVFRSRAAQIPVQVGTVGHLGHEGLPEAEGPVAVVIFGNHADGVATGVGGVVIGAIVVDRPVHELGVTVATHAIQIEEISHTELSRAQFEATNRQGCRQGEGAALGFDRFSTQRDNLTNHGPREVWSGPERRVAHYVDVDKSCQSERVAHAAAIGRFNIREEFRCMSSCQAKIKRGHVGRGVFRLGMEAVLSTVLGVK